MAKIKNLHKLDKINKRDILRLLKKIENDSHKNKDTFTCLVVFLSQTGLRVSEALNIKVADVSKTRFIITGKGEKERIVYLHSKLKTYLRKFIKENELIKNDYLFKGYNTTNKIDRSNFFTYLKKIAGLARMKKAKIYPHCFRHFFIENCLHSGLNLITTRFLAGHALKASTDVYYIEHEDIIKERLKKLWLF